MCWRLSDWYQVSLNHFNSLRRATSIQYYVTSTLRYDHTPHPACSSSSESAPGPGSKYNRTLNVVLYIVVGYCLKLDKTPSVFGKKWRVNSKLFIRVIVSRLTISSCDVWRNCCILRTVALSSLELAHSLPHLPLSTLFVVPWPSARLMNTEQEQHQYQTQSIQYAS